MDYAKEYGALHDQKGGKWFPGWTLKRYVEDVATLVKMTEPRSILDYGCGKGYQYLVRRLHEQWGGPLPYCYDIGVRQLSDRPDRKFDGVICTDMLEHIEQKDLPKILDDILGFITDEDRPTFAFLSASCRPSEHKLLSDGRNVHVTIKPPEWWHDLLTDAKLRRGLPKLEMRAAYEQADGPVIRDEKFLKS